MPLDLGTLVSGPVMAQPTTKVTDLSAHVEGPSAPGNGVSNSSVDEHTRKTMHYAAGIVIAAVLALWALGGLVVKSVNL